MRDIIQRTKDEAQAKGKYLKIDGIEDISEPTFQSRWLVENCAEVWAVRDAILQGAKLENIVLRSVELESGLAKPFCKNCEKTFEDLMKSMD